LSRGLKKALYNFMLGLGFEYPITFWFDHPVPETTIPADFIQQALQNE